MKINGIPLENYSVVYATARDSARSNLFGAALFRDALEKKTGIVLSVLSDVEFCFRGSAIFVGNDFEALPIPHPDLVCEEMTGAVSVFGEHIFFFGGGSLSVYLAVKDFTDKYFSEGWESEEIQLRDEKSSYLDVFSAPLTAGAEFRAMTYNILAEYLSWGTYLTVEMRSEAFKSLIDIYSPDVVGLQEVSELWGEAILRTVCDRYEFVYMNTPDGRFPNLSTIIYKPERFMLLDKGLQYYAYNGPNKIRLVTWAILKERASGKEFAFFNTHWGFWKPEIHDAERKSHSEENALIINHVMATHPDVQYAFSTADFNTPKEHEYSLAFMENAHLVNSFDLAKAAETLKNDTDGRGEAGTSRRTKRGGSHIDNIYVTNNMQVLAYETIVWNATEHVSDHSPKYIDVFLCAE